MKRHGQLFERIAAFDNLLSAARKALRGKKDRLPVAEFYFHLEPELLRLEEELLADTYQPRPYRTFMVYEPKPRRICAADIRDRVVHHAICQVLDPIFEGFSIHDSYACRKDRGTHRAIRRAQEFSRKNRYFLKLDVHHFFETVDHACLKGLLARKFKDYRLLALLEKIIDQPIPEGKAGMGLPIGNLTSQYFANFYLGYVDHQIKDYLGVKSYLRYMDDMLVFGDDKAELHRLLSAVRSFLRERLLLELKECCFLAPAGQGIPFLGFRVFPGTIRLQRAGWTRFKRKVRQREQEYREGQIDEQALVQSVQSLLGHIQHANTCHLRRSFLQVGWGRHRLQPRDPGRQLQQRSPVDAVGESQQRRAGQSQQQPRRAPVEHRAAARCGQFTDWLPAPQALSRSSSCAGSRRTNSSLLLRPVGPNGFEGGSGITW